MQLKNMQDFWNAAFDAIALSSFSKLQLIYSSSFLWAQNTEGHFLRYGRRAANTLGDVTNTKILEDFRKSSSKSKKCKFVSRAPNFYDCHMKEHV